MKKLLTIIVILFSITSIHSEIKREGNTFKVEQTTSMNQDTETIYKWQDKQGIEYPIFITKSGSCYIKRVSKKTGKEYKQYLKKEIQEQIKKELGYEK